MSCGFDGAVHERLAGAHVVALVHADVLALRDQVLARLAAVPRASRSRVRLPRESGPNDDDAVDLGDDRGLLRLARLEQLRHARQTARDVLRLGRLARHLGEHVAGRDLCALDRRRGARRPAAARAPIASSPASFLIEMRGRSSGSFDSMITFDDRPVNSSTCSCIVDAFDDVAELHAAADLGEDRVRERIPLERACRPPSRAAPSVDLQRARRTRPGSARARGRSASTIADLAVAVHRDRAGPRGRAPCAGSMNADLALAARLERATARRAASPCRRCGTCAS